MGKPDQPLFLKDPRFFRTPYVGQHGWVSLRINAAPLHWPEVRGLAADQLSLRQRGPHAPPRRPQRLNGAPVSKTPQRGEPMACNYDTARCDYSTFMPTLVTSRAGPSNGDVTTARISLPSFTTTNSKLTNPPVLGTIRAVPVQSAFTW